MSEKQQKIERKKKFESVTDVTVSFCSNKSNVLDKINYNFYEQRTA